MDETSEGLFLSLEDVKALFTLLKAREYALANAERQVLAKVEDALYARLSVDEVEALLPSSGGEPRPSVSSPSERRVLGVPGGTGGR
jgi:hypothetical protein